MKRLACPNRLRPDWPTLFVWCVGCGRRASLYRTDAAPGIVCDLDDTGAVYCSPECAERGRDTNAGVNTP